MSELTEEQKQGMRRLREGWEEVEAFETELLRKQTIQEKVQEYLELMRFAAPFWARTEQRYQAEREAALIELQRRLAQAGEYWKTHRHGPTAGFTHQHSETTE